MARKKQGKEITLNPDIVVKIRGFYMDNKTLITRIAATVAALFFIFYIAFRFYVSSIEKVDTVMVYEQTINNSIFTQGFFVREEQYIENSVTGTIVPVAADGKKVSNGNTVAIAFGSDEDAATYTRINMLKSELTRYEKLRAVSPSSAIDTKTVDAIISGSVSGLMDSVLSGELDTLSDGYSELRDNIIKKQLILGKAISFDNIINGIKDELAALEAKNISSKEILADGSGYYINTVDGFENAYDYSQIASITPENVQALLTAEPADVPENIMGKLVTGFKWYIVCVLDIEQIGELKVGKNVTVDFPYASTDKLTTKVAAINVSGADKAAVLLECSTMNEELANMRLEDIELIFNTAKGFKIPNSAVREENGVKGVYILRNSLVTFREINIVWSDDEYVLSADPPEPDTEGKTKEEKEEILAALPDNQVRQYDEVIVEGKDLYDGKTIN
ncbi:MAG: hypothetical protein IIW48_03570 [Clostridia bacterium]|nr:hypothetical protein [Clostridia bacterium]